MRDFLYEAIFIPEGVEPLPRDVVDLPELKLYIQDFGKKQDDCCLVVEYDGKVVGAVWTRIMNDYGHVDDETPSLSISLYKEYRNKGMGRQLMKEMMKLLESKGYHHVSLSVQKDNYAVRMYLKLGFTIMKETEEEFIMVRDITKEASNYQRFLSGEYCNRLDSEVLNMIIQTRELLSMLDNITLSEEERTALFVRMLGKVGQHSSIGRNFTCQCGKHIFIGEKTIINDFSAIIQPGTQVAIVGPTGAGKTTMVKLLMRFYDVSGGSIKVDGHDIREFDRGELRRMFGMVLQDTWLFKGSVEDNIRYGKLDATHEDVVKAADAAYAHRFIQTLPGGYGMELNEEASNVSQGQKQLLTIARAILADPKILILDEATSSVDTRTEVRIQKAMDNLMKGRTSFIIAHRLSTIRDADLILVMKEGDIVEMGRHEELLAKNGFYADLYNSQFEQTA